MPKQDVAQKVIQRIIHTISEPIPLGRTHNNSIIANIAAVLFGNNDADVKNLRGINGPIAESVAYIEKANDDILIILPNSRRYIEGNFCAEYTAAVLDQPGDFSSARCVKVDTEYLKNLCDPVDINEVSLEIQSALLSALSPHHHACFR